MMNDSRVMKIIREQEFHPKKSLGQNFILDEGILARMVHESGIQPTDTVLEIGPGAGTLTQQIAKAAYKVVSVEIDRALAPVLEKTLSGLPQVSVVWGDLLKMDLSTLHQESLSGVPIRVMANLPYYITTPILMALLESDIPLLSITVMVQKEVADRIAAQPGGKEYGILTVMVAIRTEPRILFTLPPDAFWPPPSVFSSVVHLDVRDEPLVNQEDMPLFRRLVRAAFSARRKQIKNNMDTFDPSMNREVMEKVLLLSGIDPKDRAETVSVARYVALMHRCKEVMRQRSLL